MRLELFLFRYRDDLSGKWKRARYVAQRHVIAERFAEFEIIGPPRIRNVDPGARYFTSRNDATKSPTRSQPERLSGCISA